MYQLVLRDGKVIATHEAWVDIVDKYPGCEIVTTSMHPDDTAMGFGPDPRTEEEKKQAYKDKRRLEYPTIADQLDMLHHDAVNGTTVWRDALTSVKVKYPKPADAKQ